MDMTNSVTLPSAQARVWEALNDPAILKQCINGCESIEKTGENAFKVAMTVVIGPCKAKFKGSLRLRHSGCRCARRAACVQRRRNVSPVAMVIGGRRPCRDG